MKLSVRPAAPANVLNIPVDGPLGHLKPVCQFRGGDPFFLKSIAKRNGSYNSFYADSRLKQCSVLFQKVHPINEDFYCKAGAYLL